MLSFLKRYLWGGRGPHMLPDPPADAVQDAFLAVFGQGAGQMVLQHLYFYVTFGGEGLPGDQQVGRQDTFRYILLTMQHAYQRQEGRNYGRGQRDRDSGRDYLSVGERDIRGGGGTAA